MKITILASTKPGYEISQDEILEYSGKSAAICYERTTLDDVFAEEDQKSIKRAKGCIKRGHHSVFGHVFLSLALNGIPKILAMFLNNEKVYNTSEKSARYTQMKPSEVEEKLYYKWIDIYTKEIMKAYPNFSSEYSEKLAQENARYLISIFTPATDMEYTASIRQWNYIMYWAEQYIAQEEDTPFSIRMKKVFRDFLDNMPDIKIEGLNTDIQNRNFSIIANRSRSEYFGEVYSTNYEATFSCLAQEHRHKGIWYEFMMPDKPKFFVPPIIKGSAYEDDWLKDIESLSEFIPQGTLIKINERGTCERFILKCYERLCGAVQLETMNQTNMTMKKYIEAVKISDPAVYKEFLPYSKGARCTFPGFKCKSPCMFGAIDSMTRKI